MWGQLGQLGLEGARNRRPDQRAQQEHNGSTTGEPGSTFQTHRFSSHSQLPTRREASTGVVNSIARLGIDRGAISGAWPAEMLTALSGLLGGKAACGSSWTIDVKVATLILRAVLSLSSTRNPEPSASRMGVQLQSPWRHPHCGGIKVAGPWHSI